MTTAALRHLVDIRWHSNSPQEVPFPQVAQVYMKCFDASHLISEYSTLAREAAKALVQLCLHRMCSGKDSDHKQDVVTDALRHLSHTQDGGTLGPLSTILRSIREPDWDHANQWETYDFDLPWESEVWMYRVWLRRSQLGGYIVGGVFTGGNVLAPVEKLFKKGESLPPVVVQNILYGLLGGVSSSSRPFDNLISLQRWETSALSGTNEG